jgi:hypothetical protein
MSSTQLIELYCTVCEQYCNTIGVEVQRMSNNSRPKFTDEEAIATYLWGTLQGYCEQKTVYRYIQEHYSEWFPCLPSYQKYSYRLNLLMPAIMALTEELILLGEARFTGIEQAVDSLPIIVANQARSGTAKAAGGLCDKGYCATKKLYYYGVKLHAVGTLRPGKLPFPSALYCSRASDYDLTMAKAFIRKGHRLYGDKAYCDEGWRQELRDAHGITLITPVKKKKGQEALSLFDELYSSSVSSKRQPIESFFSWLIAKTRIQSASKVRSVSGLLLHIFGKLAACLFALVFG